MRDKMGWSGLERGEVGGGGRINLVSRRREELIERIKRLCSGQQNTGESLRAELK
jgi:hypothetical protein